jgi:predicted outer membrane repeat protein
MISESENSSSPDYITGIRQFTWNFSDLGITARDMELYLGFEPGNVPDPFPEMIEAAFSEAPELFEIRTGFRILDTIQFHRYNHATETGGVIFSTGKVVFSQTHKAVRLALFAGTAGHRVTERCRELNRLDESVYSYVLDVMGSLVAGKSVDRMMDDLEKDVSHSGWHISESYSPGYCDWDVSEQQKLFSFFPPGFLGISLSSSSLMSPVKSVSGLIGIGPGLKRNGYQCHLCNDTSCMFGKIRRDNQMK